jgi:hypothetical protein
LVDSGLLSPFSERNATPAPAPEPIAADSAPVPAPVAAPTATPAAPIAAAPVASAPAVRKRGTTGLHSGHSSAVPTDVPGESAAPAEPSVSELRKLPMSELKRIAQADRQKRAGVPR